MRVRALLIVNPRATTTTRPVLDLIVRTLAAEADIETVETRYRGHARDIATAAAAEGRDALLVLSGDGTINEVVNGLMQEVPIRAGHPPATASQLPALGAIPGGNANVFTRDLGLPGDPAAAARVISARLAAGTTRTIGLGLAGRRYFTSNAGLGWDAEVVRAVEEARGRGRRASPGLYMRMALRQYYRENRPAAPGAGPGNAGRDHHRPAGPGPDLQHHPVVVHRPASGEPDARRQLRHRAGRVRAAPPADLLHAQRHAPDDAARRPAAHRKVRGKPAR